MAILESDNVGVSSYEPFITRWLLDTDTIAGRTITIPILGIHNVTIDWGDGTIVTSTNAIPNLSHEYTTIGVKTISITGRMITLRFNNTGDKDKITDVLDGGYTGLGNLSYMFYGCSNLKNVAGGNWTRSAYDTAEYCFSGCTSLDCDISDWDVSGITDMQYMFQDCDAFNSPLNDWNVRKVTNMAGMFTGCNVFNQPLDRWDMSGVTSIAQIFNNCAQFNGDVANWDTSNLTIMNNTFSGCTNFNQDVSNWDVSNVVNFSKIFWFASSFNQSLANWDISSGTNFFDFLNGAGLSTANYDATLIGWDGLVLQPSENVNVNGLTYTSAGAGGTARANIISNYSWNFVGDSGV